MSIHESTIRLLDRFVPADIRNDVTLGLDTRLRARATATMLIFSLAVPVVLLFVFGALQLITGKDFTTALIALGVVLMVLICEYVVFHSACSLHFTAVAFSITFFLTTASATFMTGGWDSPVKQLLFCAPMISFIIAGRQEGVYTALLVMFSGIGFYLLEANGFHTVQIMHEENRNLVLIAMWVVTSFILIICLSIYDAMLESLSTQLRRLGG